MADIGTIYNYIPGKTDTRGNHLPLWMHLEDTAGVMEYLIEHRISDSVFRACGLEKDEFRKVCIFLAMVHDIGKCTPLFASKICPYIARGTESVGKVLEIVPPLFSFPHANRSPHARASEALLEDFGCPNGIFSVVGAHHGKPTSEADRDEQLTAYKSNYYAGDRDLWNALQTLVLENALGKAGYSSVGELPVLTNCAQMLLCGIVIQADWIASNQTYFSLLSADENPTPDVYPNRIALACSALALPDTWQCDRAGEDPALLFEDRFGFTPNAVQECVTQTVNAMSDPGLVIIEAQMGVGKTEAAMAAAEMLCARTGCGGIFFGLPTQATSNGIFPRIAAWAESVSQNSRHAIRLVHGMAELNDNYRTYAADNSSEKVIDQSLVAHSWFSGKKQALLADFVIGTVDTALMAALSQKHVMLRHLGLCGKTVVIDECHAYDAYMSRFIDRLLTWLGAYGVPVILLSATLPPNRKREMLRAYTGNKKLPLPGVSGYPLITWTEAGKASAAPVNGSFKQRAVALRRLPSDALADDIEEKLRNGGCAGIIVNTVKRAQAIAVELQTRFPDHKV